jgi:hypothetical protein
MTRRELLARTTIREREEWAAYFALEPFGEERADLRSAIVASTVANANRGRKTPAFKASDFMPKFTRPKPGLSAIDLKITNGLSRFLKRGN